MLELINQIISNQSKNISLFFEKKRIGEEVKKNLVSISAKGIVLDQNEKKLLIDTLLETISKIEKNLSARYPNRKMIFYLWFDRGAEVLRWSVVSDMNQPRLPFSSNVEEVAINKVVDNWLSETIENRSEKLSPSEIDNMTPSELRTLMGALKAPSLDVFVCRFNGCV